MTTLFDIGDTIELTMKGKVKSFSASKDGDCYVISIKYNSNSNDEMSVYLNSNILKECQAKKIRE